MGGSLPADRTPTREHAGVGGQQPRAGRRPPPRTSPCGEPGLRSQPPAGNAGGRCCRSRLTRRRLLPATPRPAPRALRSRLPPRAALARADSPRFPRALPRLPARPQQPRPPGGRRRARAGAGAPAPESSAAPRARPVAPWLPLPCRCERGKAGSGKAEANLASPSQDPRDSLSCQPGPTLPLKARPHVGAWKPCFISGNSKLAVNF